MRLAAPAPGMTGVSVFFALMYFVQGIGDPSSGLIAQPVRALLKTWGESPTQIGTFMALLALPWMLKPAFALLSDFVPVRGSHRRTYLLLSTAAAGLGLFGLYAQVLPAGAHALMFVCLLLPMAGIAFGDVLVDALMIEYGQPRGLTGRLQAVQWTAVYVAMLVSGVLGGYFSSRGSHETAFLICACLWACAFALAWRYAQDVPRPPQKGTLADDVSSLRDALRAPALLVIAAFLFVWSFNPSWETVQYLHVTQALDLGEQAYGTSSSLFAAGCVVAAVLYGWYCRQLAPGRLVHVAIAAGVIGYLAYLHIADAMALYGVAFVAGLANMTGNLIQLDLAARLVPLRHAATCFALLMALTNLSAGLAEALGAWLYEYVGALLGEGTAYGAIVLLSALIAASCWLLVPRLRRELPQWWTRD